MKPMHWLALTLTIPPATQAATVYRCLDDQGQVTFTEQGCAPEQGAPLSLKPNQPMESDKATLSSSRRKPPSSPGEEHVDRAANNVVVVGTAEDMCDDQLSDRDRRTAILRRQIRPGMTQADVESALGKPDRVTGSNAKLRYHYEHDPKHVVTFDARGCVPRK